MKKMISNAENYLQKKINRLVVTVPADFTNSQKKMMIRAGDLSNIKIIKILNEPYSAALSYGIKNKKKGDKILVFDLGGSKFNISILSFNEDKNINNYFNLLSTYSDNNFGGKDFDNAFVKYIMEKCSLNDSEINYDEKKRLKNACKYAKIILSESEETNLWINNFCNKNELFKNIRREQFEKICEPLILKIKNILDNILLTRHIEKYEIKEVILVGGSTKIPKIKELIFSFFDENIIIKDSIDPQEVVAYGATIFNEKMLHNNNKNNDYNKNELASNSFTDSNFFYRAPLSIGISVHKEKGNEEKNDEINIIFEKGAYLPNSEERYFYTTYDDQTTFNLKIYEGEKNIANENILLKEINLDNLEPRPKGKTKIKVHFSIEENDNLYVKVKEENENKNKNNNIYVVIKDDGIQFSNEKINTIKEKIKIWYKSDDKKLFENIDYTNIKDMLNRYKMKYYQWSKQQTKNKKENEGKIYIFIFKTFMEEFINSFEHNFKKEILLEKHYIYIRELFLSYAEILNRFENSLTKLEIYDIFENIEKYLNIFIVKNCGYLNNLIDIFSPFKKGKFFRPFYDLIIQTMTKLNQNGIKSIEKENKFWKYHSLVYFEKSYSLYQLYFSEGQEKVLAKNLLSDLNEQKKMCINYIHDIQSGAIFFEKESLSENDLFFKDKYSNNLIEAWIKNSNKFNYDKNKLILILTEFQKLLAQIQIFEEPSEKEAKCIANIIKIFFNYNLYFYKTKYVFDLANKCYSIIEQLEINKQEKWCKEFLDLYQNMEQKNDQGKIRQLHLDFINEQNKIFDKFKNNYYSILVDRIQMMYPDLFNNSDISEFKKNINPIENYKEHMFFFSCRQCNKIPKIIIKDNEKIIFKCDNCNIEKLDKIIDILNSKSKWLSKDFKSFEKNVIQSQKKLNDYSHKLIVLNSIFNNIPTFLNNQYKFISKFFLTFINKNRDDEDKIIDKKITSQILNIYISDLKNKQNMFLLAVIIFNTFKLDINDIRKDIYKYIFDNLSNLFKEGELEQFKIKLLKKRYEIISNFLSKNEIIELYNYIGALFNPNISNNNNISMDIRQKKFIEKSIIFSSLLKKYICIEQKKNPDNYIDIDKAFYNDNIYNNLNSLKEENFSLCLIAKFLQNNGVKVLVSKNKKENIKDISLCSLLALFSLGNKKKYELHFNIEKKKKYIILNKPEEKDRFLKEWKAKNSKELNIDENKIILEDVHPGCLSAYFATFGLSVEEEQKLINNLRQINEVIEINEMPVIEYLELNPNILDQLGNRFNEWGIEEIRGNEDYIPPLNNWAGIGLKVTKKYDNGNDDWLDYRNNLGEYAIAYLNINNLNNDKDKIFADIKNFTNIENLSQNLESIKNKLFINDMNSRSNNEARCGEGVCTFQNPDYAENGAGYIDIPGYRIKVILMCRVNPNNIRQPSTFPECWIINSDEIRPYRILIKKISTSPLTEEVDKIKLEVSPLDYVIDAINSKDYSFFDLSRENKYIHYLKKVNDDKKIDERDYFVIRLYSGEYYSYINNYLINHIIERFTEKQLKSWTCCLQLALSRNRNVEEGDIVYRGLSPRFPSGIGVGSKFYFSSFVSTSKSINFCKSRINNNGTILIIKIKNNGTNGHPNYCFYLGDISCFPTEEEILISSHCYFTVTKIESQGQIDYVSLICEGYLIE